MTAKELTEKVQAIMEQIRPIKEEAIEKEKPFRAQIVELEQSFLDEYLKDKNGETVKCGMTLQNNEGHKFTVEKRYQQCLFEYLGNAQVSLLPVGKKREVSVGYRVLAEDYIIVDVPESPEQEKGGDK